MRVGYDPGDYDPGDYDKERQRVTELWGGEVVQKILKKNFRFGK